MKENIEKITVKLKYDPNKDDTIEVKISQNATVSELEEKVKNTLGNLNDVPMGILKFNEQELDDKNKTLADLGMKDGSIIENENRVFLKTLNGQKIGITCDGNTTLKKFLEKARDPEVLQNDVFIRLAFQGRMLSRKDLENELFSVPTDSTIGYGSILHMVLLKTQEESNYDTVFNLKNLDSTSEEVKKAYQKYQESKINIIGMEYYSFQSNCIPNQKSGNGQKRKLQNNWPLSRKIIGVIDLILFAAAVAAFLLFFLSSLSLSIAIPIVLAALFVTFAVLFLGWNTILPKILPDNCLKKPNLENTLDEKNKDKIEEIGNNEKTNPEEEYKGKKKEEENDSL